VSARYDVRRRALNELDAIRDYTRNAWGAAQARRYIADLTKTFASASRHPERYHSHAAQ
jgi:plasmid stabilization system protein ParE